MSYFMGWLSVLGWQASVAGGAYITGTQLQGLGRALNYLSYIERGRRSTTDEFLGAQHSSS